MSDRKYRAFVKQARRNGVEFQNREAIRRLRGVHWSINDREALRRQMALYVVDGEIGVVIDSMDCDCTQSHCETVRKVRPLIVEWWSEERARQDAEGPRYVSYRCPEMVRDGFRRTSDRALAAYEDGHPSSVDWIDLGPDDGDVYGVEEARLAAQGNW